MDRSPASSAGRCAIPIIGIAGSIVVNAALGGATYRTNCAIHGEEVKSADFLMTTAIGGSGANGKKLRGVYSTAKDVLRQYRTEKSDRYRQV